MRARDFGNVENEAVFAGFTRLAICISQTAAVVDGHTVSIDPLLEFFINGRSDISRDRAPTGAVLCIRCIWVDSDEKRYSESSRSVASILFSLAQRRGVCGHCGSLLRPAVRNLEHPFAFARPRTDDIVSTFYRILLT